MRIPDSKIAEVAAAADIVRVISHYVDLKKAGKDYRGLCPFHGDTDPSFYVSPQKGIFHCFGCAVGGSVFNFIMKMEGVSFVEAVQSLAKQYGVPFEMEEGPRKSRDERDRVIRALEVAHRYFKRNLQADSAAGAYLSDRGISADWIETIGFGFAPDAWEGIQGDLGEAGVELRDAASAGLVRQRSSGGYYDYFRSRIMIPIHSLNGTLTAFGGRILGDGEPKYLNSPESMVFRKRGTLYGLDAARDAIRREGFAIVVEGYFDQISLRIRGFENTVAPMGTALVNEQVRMIKRFAGDVITVFDGDEAGLRAVKRAIPLFLSEGIEPRCVILEQDKDPDEAILRLGADRFRRLLDRSESMIDFLLNSLSRQYDLTRLQGRNFALEECLPVLREIADSKERDYLIERFASRIRVREERVRRMVAVRPRNQGSEAKERERRSLFDFPGDERNVVRGMLLREGFIDRVIESGVLKDLEDPVLARLAEMMVGFSRHHDYLDPLAFSRSLEDEELASVIAAWLEPKPEENDLRPEVDGDRTIEQSLDRIRLRKLDRRKAEIKERMKQCSPDDGEFAELAQELWAIGQRLHR